MEGTATWSDFMTSPFQSVIQSVSPQFAMAHPYGLMAQQYNYDQYSQSYMRSLIIMDEEYFDVIMRGGPIPGSSLTSDPDDPAPYEQPPEYVNVHEASELVIF